MHAIGFGAGFRLNRRGGGRPAFDFTGGALPAGASLTRASAATRCDAAGVLAGAASDVARFDYDPVGHALRGLLLEPAAANAVLDSRDWTQASWSPANITATATALVETTANGGHRMLLPVANRSFTNGVPVVLSVIASELAGSAKRYLGLVFQAVGFAASPNATFDLASGTVTQVANGTAGCVAAAGGWLCWLSATPNADVTTGSERYYLSNVGTSALPIYTGDGASGLTVGEMQLETGTVPTSRMRSGAGAGSRAADALTLDWGSQGVPDGAITVRYGFDDGSVQDVAATVSGGLASVPTTLNRAWLRRVEKI